MDPSTHTILVVEDNQNDIQLLKRAFKKAEITNPLQFLTDGDSAVAYLSGDGSYGDRVRFPLPALILLDLKLPRRSGHEVLGWLREQDQIRRIPVVVLTSSKQPDDVQKAYDIGVNSYLVKPVGFEALLEMMKAVGIYWTVLNEKPVVGV
jgi:CheY-like chemotaxis protein